MHLNLGNALRDKGQLDEAIAEFQEAIRVKKDYAEAHTNLGMALHAKGRLDEAIAEFQEAIRVKKDYAEAHTCLGIALHDTGRLDEAIAEHQEAIRLKKDFAEAHDNLGIALHAKARLDEAIAEYQQAIRLKKDDALAHYNLGIALYAKGRLDEAIAEYQEAIRLKKDDAKAHCNLGIALGAKGRLDEAIAEYQEAIRLKKDFAEGHNGLGIVLRAKGRLDEAIAEHQEAIRLKKDYAEAHYNLGAALHAKGRLDEAIAEHQEAIRLKKDFAVAHNNLGNALHAKGRLDEAIAEHQEAIRLKKDYAEPHYNLGIALHAKGRLDEAIAEYREAIRLKKDYAVAHYNLGTALHAKGRLDEAIAEYQEAIRLKKDDAEAHCNLGSVLEQLGRFTEAVAARKRGHELGSQRPGWRYPSAEWVRQAEQLVALDARLAKVLQGEAAPADAGERIALAKFCQERKKLFAAAARFYAAGFAAEPKRADDLARGLATTPPAPPHWPAVARARTPPRSMRRSAHRLRRQALDWLGADLAAWARVLDNDAKKATPALARQLRRWLADADFAALRGDKALAQLPEAERQPWQKLWHDVTDLLSRARRAEVAELLERFQGDDGQAFRLCLFGIESQLGKRDSNADALAGLLLKQKDGFVAAAEVQKLLDEIADQKSPVVAAELLLRIAQARRVVKDQRKGHVIVGQVIVADGRLDPELVLAQMPIRADGYFAGEVGDLERPVGFCARLRAPESGPQRKKGRGGPRRYLDPEAVGSRTAGAYQGQGRAGRGEQRGPGRGNLDRHGGPGQYAA